jgi:osmotically-inducible protein OsmY
MRGRCSNWCSATGCRIRPSRSRSSAKPAAASFRSGTSATNATGHVNSYAEKLAAIAAVRRIKGVHAIAESIEVRYPYQNKTADDQIAKRAVDIISWDVHIPAGAVNVLVQDKGWVTLSGTVDWYYQRRGAEDDVRKLSGVRGVTNQIAIKPSVDTSNVKSKIEAALKRHAEVEAKAIRVTVQNGNKVVLEGKVDNWDERRAVEECGMVGSRGFFRRRSPDDCMS